MKYLLWIGIFIICSIIPTFAQEPQWINKPPLPSYGNKSYTFVVINADAKNLDIGRKKCFQMLSLDQGLLNTVTTSYRSEDIIKGTQKYKDGEFYENLDEQSLEIITTEGKPIQLKAKIVDEYFNGNQMTTLYQVGTTPNAHFDDTYVTTQYGVQGLWRSAIVPGWGQFHKRSYLKGGLILGGSVLLAGGIIYTECMRADYKQKLYDGHTGDADQLRFYYNSEKNFALARNICIGGLCALYVYNLIDAIVAPGARYVKVSTTDRNGNVYTIAPSINYDGSPMIAGSIRF